VATGWNPYDDFYKFKNYGLFNEGGDCYGFSSSSILYFRHYELGDQTFPYYPEPTPSVAALPGQTGKYCLFGVCFAQGDTLYQSTFPIYIHQAYDPNRFAFVPSDEAPYVQLLKQSIQSGVPVVLTLGPAEFHAIVAWEYTQYSNGNLIIGVSDPNFGNVPRYAYYTDGQFSYKGSGYTYTTFGVVSPGVMQWSWLSFDGINAALWSSTVNATNPYYTYIFSSVPITIVAGSGETTSTISSGTSVSNATTTSSGAAFSGASKAYFTSPANSLTFNSTISGVVGFEEGGIQVYGIPKGIQYTIVDPDETSSLITVVIPQNQTSVVGYQLTMSSLTPLQVTIVPSDNGLRITTSHDIKSSVVLFSVGQSSHSVLNATSLPVNSSQTALYSVPDWGRLNSTQSAASLQVYPPNSNTAVLTYTLTNTQQGLPRAPSPAFPVVLVFSALAVVVVVLAAVFLVRRRRM